MKKFLLLLLIVCIVASLFSCAVQNENNGSTNTATDTSASADISTDDSTNTSIQASAPSTDTDLSGSSKNAKNDTQGEENMQKFVLKGIVIAINDKLEIEVIESDYAFGIYHVIVPNDIPITDKNGNAIALNDLKADDIVLVKYNGQTMLSYPPQIVAHGINLQ